MKKILKYLRVAISLFCLTVTTSLAAGWISSLLMAAELVEGVQFIPLVLAISVPAIIIWLVVTYIFGRVYCSTVCPLGTFQDICIRLPRMTRRREARYRFNYSAPLSTLRYSTLAVVAATLMAGLTTAVCILDPNAIYVRLIKLIAADVAEASVVAYFVSFATVSLIAVLAARRGRLWCNTMCPVGSTLGIVSRHSVYHFDINTDLCINCGRCRDVCKAECINLNDHVVDGSRCVNCFNCIGVCPNNAINYTSSRHNLSIPMMQRQ